jgi:hypothetical protein
MTVAMGAVIPFPRRARQFAAAGVADALREREDLAEAHRERPEDGAHSRPRASRPRRHVFPAPPRLWYRDRIMAADKSVTEKILHVLRPYASNWSGTLGRGDLVIPQREIPRVIHEILNAVHELAEVRKEVPEGEVFQVLMESRRLPSVQDQLRALQKRFLIVSR